MKASETATVSSSAASVSSDLGGDLPPLDDGEYAILAATLVELVVSSDHTVRSSDATTSTSTSAPLSATDNFFYGSPLSKEEAAKRMPLGSGGLVWNAIVIPDNFCSENGNILRGLNRRDFHVANNTASIKTRRPSLPITVTQLFSSLTKIEGTGACPRYIFNGILNGWPSLCTFELIELEKKRSIGPLTPPDYMDSSKLTWAHYWGVDDEVQTEPSILNDAKKIFRAKLRGAPWTSMGW
jgi:hypothetical protein